MHKPGEAKKLGLLAEMPSSTRMQVRTHCCAALLFYHCLTISTVCTNIQLQTVTWHTAFTLRHISLHGCPAGLRQSHFLSAWVRFARFARPSQQHWSLCTTHNQWVGSRTPEDPAEARSDQHPIWPWTLDARTGASTVPLEEAKPRIWSYWSQGDTTLLPQQGFPSGWVYPVREVQRCLFGAGTVLITIWSCCYVIMWFFYIMIVLCMVHV